MQIKLESSGPTSIKLNVVADQPLLSGVKTAAVSRLSRNLKVPGFRAGKAPLHLVEKQIDQELLQSEFMEMAINRLYVDAIQEKKLRPVAQPGVNVLKFVPFTTLEVSFDLEVLGKVKLPDLSKIKLVKPSVTVSDKDVTEVISGLQTRAAVKEDVERAAKSGDQTVIDFNGVDAKTQQPIAGATGTDYPLILGSSSFIPGFEDNLVGLKAGQSKDFPITFPPSYGTPELQNRKVIFSVTVKKVQSVIKPKLDQAFIESIGPFKSLKELKDEIKQQLKQERSLEAERAYENQLLELIAIKAQVAIPKLLVEEEVERMEEEEKRNVSYRGQTWEQHLQAEKLTEIAHREKQVKTAEIRVKAGLVLGEIADQHSVTVTPQELEEHISLLKKQYSDPAMQAEIDKPESRSDILNRIISQKSLDKAKELVNKG